VNSLFIIDASNFLYKYKSTLNLSTKNSAGVTVNVSAPYGFYRTIKACEFDDIVIALDGYPKLFKEYYPEYKSQRSKEFDEVVRVPLNTVMSFVLEIARVYGKRVRVVCSPFQEADQVISSIVHAAHYPAYRMFYSTLSDIHKDKMLKDFVEWDTEKFVLDRKYDRIVVGTTDSDMYQLLKFKDVYISTHTNGSQFELRETPKAVQHLAPEVIPAYKAIIGDVSDNIPSVRATVSLSELKHMFNDCLSEPEDLIKFANAIKSGSNPPSGTRKLYDAIINSGNAKQFLLNMKITTLVFYAMPWQLNSPKFDLDSFIKEYSFKLE